MWTEGLTDMVKLTGALSQLVIANVTRTEIPYNNCTLGNYIKETEMARISGTVEEQEMHAKFWLGNLLKDTTWETQKGIKN
jgi:hypothetical protein